MKNNMQIEWKTIRRAQWSDLSTVVDRAEAEAKLAEKDVEIERLKATIAKYQIAYEDRGDWA